MRHPFICTHLCACGRTNRGNSGGGAVLFLIVDVVGWFVAWCRPGVVVCLTKIAINRMHEWRSAACYYLLRCLVERWCRITRQMHQCCKESQSLPFVFMRHASRSVLPVRDSCLVSLDVSWMQRIKKPIIRGVQFPRGKDMEIFKVTTGISAICP